MLASMPTMASAVLMTRAELNVLIDDVVMPKEQIGREAIYAARN
jgi:hypothetical protein